MISVNDPYNLVPELFKSFPEFSLSVNGEVDILSIAIRPDEYPESNKLTIFIQPEPDMGHADTRYAEHMASRPNSVWAVSGFSLDQPWTYKNWFLYLASVASTVQVNRGIPPVATGSKSYVATALLGGWLPSRGLLLNEIQRHGLLDQCLVNYYDRAQLTDTLRKQWKSLLPQRFFNYRTPALDHLDDPMFVKIAFDDSIDKINTCRPIPTTTPGQYSWISQLIPYKVYNSAYISLVAESEPGVNPNRCFFMSEKIAKPMLLAQPFLVYGGQCYLKNLRSLGFQTFDPWLDESYDLISHPESRACAVIESLNSFAKLSEAEKINRIAGMKSALEHNRALIQNQQWIFGPIAGAIKKYLEQ